VQTQLQRRQSHFTQHFKFSPSLKSECGHVTISISSPKLVKCTYWHDYSTETMLLRTMDDMYSAADNHSHPATKTNSTNLQKFSTQTEEAKRKPADAVLPINGH